jgi:hypothetical protein
LQIAKTGVGFVDSLTWSARAMPTDNLTPERRRELVLAAIDRIKDCSAAGEKMLSEKGMNALVVSGLKEELKSIEAEFAWQWRNVEALLRG